MEQADYPREFFAIGLGRSAPALATLVVLFVCCFSLPTAWADHVFTVARLTYDADSLRPTLQLQQSVGGWEVTLAGYPGDPQPGEGTELQIVLKRGGDARLYRDEVGCTIRKLGLLGEDPTVFGPETVIASSAPASFHPSFQTDGDYQVTISFNDGLGISTLVFPMVVGEPGAPVLVLGSFLAGCAAFILLVRFMKSRQGVEAAA